MARVILGEGERIVFGGNGEIIGTRRGAEVVTLVSGNVTLDASFNAGGDRIVLPGNTSSYSASVSGSLMTIAHDGLTVRIPVGPNGMEVAFGDQVLVLRYDSAANAVFLGDQEIGGTPEPIDGPPEPENSAPVLSRPIADQEVDEATPWSFTVPRSTFTDADGDTLTYSARLANGDPLPAWLLFDATTRTFTGTPPDGFTGDLELLVRASDGTASASDRFVLTVEVVNAPPVVADDIDDQNAELGEAWSFTVPAGTFSDADGDTLTYSARLANGGTLPAWLSFDATTRTFSGTPTGAAGDTEIIVTASDGTASVSDRFILTVEPAPISSEISFTTHYWALGDQISVNTATAGPQTTQQIITLSGGRFVVTWEDSSLGVGGAGGDLAGKAVKAQVFEANGDPVGSEIRVNTAIAGDQTAPRITALASGGFVIAWEDLSLGVGGAPGDTSYSAVKAQRFDADGQPLGGEILVNSAVLYTQADPLITALEAGGFVVTWWDISLGAGGAGGDTDWLAVKAQVFDAAGQRQGGEILVNTATVGVQQPTDVTALDGGGFVVTWNDSSGGVGGAGGDSSNSAVKAQLFGSDGLARGTEILVNSATRDAQLGAKVTALEGGGFVVTWNDSSGGLGGAVGDRDGAAVKAQVFDADGRRSGGEILVNSATSNLQMYPQITALAGGGFVITWQDTSGGVGGAGGDASGDAVKAQLFGADGQRQGGEILVNTAVAGDQLNAKVTALDDGGFVVTWEDNSLGVGGAGGDASGTAIKAQVFDATGARDGGEILVNIATNGGQAAPEITALPGGGFVVTWVHLSGLAGDSSDTSVKAQVFGRGLQARGQDPLDLTGLIGIEDEDAAGDISVTLSVDHGVLAVAPGTTEAAVVGSGTASVTITGALSEIQALLQGRDAGEVSFTADSGQPPQSATLLVSVDDDGDVVTGSIGIPVVAANNAPIVAGAIADQSINEETAWSFTVPAALFTDADGDTLTYGASLASGAPLPSWLSFDGVTLTFSGRPPAGVTGNIELSVIASDGRAYATESFTLTIDDLSEISFGSSLRRVGTEILVNGATAGDQRNQQMIALEGGGFVVTWQDHSGGIGGAGGDDSGASVKAQVFDAEGRPRGGEIRVNSATAGDQFDPQITALANGGFVVTWEDRSLGVGGAPGDTSGLAIKAQVFNAAGAPQGGEIRVNTGTASEQFDPEIVALNDGGFVVTWQDFSQTQGEEGHAIRAQLFNADGSARGGEIRVNTGTGGDQVEPRITALASGGFAVTWEDQSGSDGSGYGIKAQVYDRTGGAIGGQINVNATTYLTQANPGITALDDGGFVVTWTDNSGQQGGPFGDTSEYGVKAQMFNANGSARGGELLVNSSTEGSQIGQQITAVDGGGFVVTWVDRGASGDYRETAIKAQLFDAAGARQGGEVLVNTAVNGAQLDPQVTALEGGGFVITWEDRSLGVGGAGGDQSGTAVKAQVFDAAGHKYGGEFLVNTATVADQNGARIIALDGGGFAISWRDTSQESGGAPGDTNGLAIKTQLFDVRLAAIEQEPYDLTGLIQIEDGDTVGDIIVTLAVAYGVLDVDAGTSGVIVANSGSQTVTLTGTLAEIQALLEDEDAGDLSFTANTDEPPAQVTLGVLVHDRGDNVYNGLVIPITSELG